MTPWIYLDTGQIPGGATLKLSQRGSEFSIRLGQIELMNSRLSGSEEALARETITRLRTGKNPRLLVGGLGMGFTLRAALAALPERAEVVVAELVPSVVQWAKGPMADLFAGCLDDPRVRIQVEDVGEIMRASPGGFDAILLDVDNGPEGLTIRANDKLYALKGLANARAALRPGGILAIWSQGPDDAFLKRLQRSRFETEEIRVRANKGKSGARHVIWFGRRLD